MVENSNSTNSSSDDTVLQQQYLRALSSFEGIVLSQIEIKNSLGNRLNYSIRTGIIILGAIAFTILVLLYTLTTQINRISNVVFDMNAHFLSVSEKMENIKINMESMERQVGLIGVIDDSIAIMDNEMQAIDGDMNHIQGSVRGIGNHLTTVRDRVGNIAVSIDQMNLEIQTMSRDIHRMGKPARSMNKMFPFP